MSITSYFSKPFKPKVQHVWKETKRENLGSYIDMGSSPEEISKVYRIGIHEECLVTGKTRIRQISSFFPHPEP